LYAESVTDPTLQTGKAAPAAFGPDCQTLRIGTQLYRRADDGTFIAISGQYFLCNLRTIYIEEFARHRQFLVLSSRVKISKGDLKVTQSTTDRTGDEDNDLDTGVDEDLQVEGDELDEDSEDEDSSIVIVSDSEGDELDEDPEDEDEDSLIETASDSEDEFECGTESEDSGNESSSEGSTNSSFELEDDILPPWANHFGGEDTDSDGENCRPFDTSGFDVEIDDEDCEDDHEEDLESSSDEDDAIPSEVFDDNLFCNEEQHDWEGLSSKRTEKRKARATITVFDTQSCTRLFRLRRPIKCRLFASPPVFHPTKSLVVWPLADGDVLFVNYLAKTYFTRRLQPSTPHSKSDKSRNN
jgi:hypothetical protein